MMERTVLKPELYKSYPCSTQTLSPYLSKHQYYRGGGTRGLPAAYTGSANFFVCHKQQPPLVASQGPINNTSSKASLALVLQDHQGEDDDADDFISVKAVISVKQTVGDFLSSFGLERGLDDIKDILGKTVLLELVSNELDPKTGLEKGTIPGFAHRKKKEGENVKFEAELKIPKEFGDVGAIFVENEHHKELFIDHIRLEGFPKDDGPVNFTCSSWVHSKYDNPDKRIFFSNKTYLPSQTPGGLRRLREQELNDLRGNGHGERKRYDRIYDYDVYNDIGEPDKDIQLKRPTLGGKHNLPYPRRCKTARPRCASDPLSEKRLGEFYVPRDECFSGVKQLTFSAKALNSLMKGLVPTIDASVADPDTPFKHFASIDSLFSEGINLPTLSKPVGFFTTALPRLVKAITDGADDVLRFETPHCLDRDKFFWFRDEEFARQTLAGLNPYSIRLVTEWPLKSKLDPAIYGDQDSAITTDLVQQEIGGFMTVEEAIKRRKLFILDYHDLLLPFVKKVRELKGTTLYGSRTLFFLMPNETLRPLAIEISRPPLDGKPQWKQVYTQSWDSTSCWLWRLAKAHVLAHDSGYHQLVSHWLRTHCATEPYIIATNRQLSAMHPIYRLLHPHFRFTMKINALARESLINAGGIIESAFSVGRYAGELSAVAYDLEWQFDLQALPADLLNRGMAIEDLTSPHGIRLTIQDYPFASDGLLLWGAIEQWVSDYVNHYYTDAGAVQSDEELRAWWTEIRMVGHADKKDAPGWPALKTPNNLIYIITTMVWVTSGHHAAVNFGQYTYGGYFPNRPTIARTKMPTEDPTTKEWGSFLKKPDAALLKCFPSRVQATKIMAVLDVLSNHSPDEEYLGEMMEEAWGEDPVIQAAFEKFNGRLKQIEGIIDERNSDLSLKNRTGAGILPYQLLKPFSDPGVTGMGVPYSISI